MRNSSQDIQCPVHNQTSGVLTTALLFSTSVLPCTSCVKVTFCHYCYSRTGFNDGSDSLVAQYWKFVS
jgi:hypothetical protein